MSPEVQLRHGQIRVLIVEDDVLVRAFVSDELRAAGFQVIEAANADEAWAFLSAGSPVDVVVSDVQMPGSMDGIELARRAGRLPSSVPVILTSGRVHPGPLPGLAGFLPKPYRLERLVGLILETSEAAGR
ncbi:response regulator [Faunimonas sp. B44]|uniref:response regulator n=1 Tax=Faunimonas sp. B44 TaxID=3461493 RepID=UPI00404413A5